MNILLVHPQFSKIGGAEKVALKMIEILIREFDAEITILCYTKFDVESIKYQTGIIINPDRISIKTEKIPAILNKNFFHTRIAILHKRAKKLAPYFPYMISTYNELDFGKPALQYIHHPMLASDKILIRNHLATQKKFPFNYVSYLYRKTNDLIANRRLENISKNLTATNSIFINNICKEIYQTSSKVIYPSIIDEPSKDSFPGNKGKQILNISRFSRKKNVHALLRTFDQIHANEPGFKFAIAGQIEDENYFNEIKNETSSRKYDIKLYPNCTRNKIINLYKKSEYYINPKQFEHFGIAVLEAIKYGCIPFVHGSGGSLEIVPLAQLQFQNFDELSDKILIVESNPSLKKELKTILSEHSNSFTKSNFEFKISELIQSYKEKIDAIG